MERYDPAGDMATRDIMTRAMFNEVRDGRDEKGNIFMDCRHLPKEILTSKFAELLRLLSKADIDPLKDLIPISPATHFFMGGIAVDDQCRTSLPGLLACGEAVGGLHGANRLGGNALSEAFVFGVVAGRRAAEGRGKKAAAEVDVEESIPFRKGDIAISELKQMLRETAWRYLSIIRDQDSAQKAHAELNRIEASLDTVNVQSVYDLVDLYELKGMITTARLIAHCSIERKESRGAHFRSDFPDTDDKTYKGSFYIRNDNGKMTSAFRHL
jgi:succinate dehydrogenase/fumarate reductase flavoprotein subunit